MFIYTQQNITLCFTPSSKFTPKKRALLYVHYVVRGETEWSTNTEFISISEFQKV